MKPANLFGALLLGIVLPLAAAAQTTLPVTGSVSDAATIPRIPASEVPGQPAANTAKDLPTPTTRPAARPSTLYPNGVPTRDIDAGTRRVDQPQAGQSEAGAQPTKSIFKGRKRRGE